MTAVTIPEMGTDGAPPSWPRWVVAVGGGLLAVLVIVAVVRLPEPDSGVWMVSGLTAVSAVVLACAVWWLTGRPDVVDRRMVLDWGLGSGLVLGGLWMAEIAFNNLAPLSVATGPNRGVVDNVTWAIVGLGTIAVAVAVTARTGRWRSGLRAGAWSGVGSGLLASLGGAVLLAFLRSFVERDPLAQAEHAERAAAMNFATYVTRETMAGVFGHLWVLGLVQGGILAALAAGLTRLVMARAPRTDP
jgi:hypothetical protein